MVVQPACDRPGLGPEFGLLKAFATDLDAEAASRNDLSADTFLMLRPRHQEAEHASLAGVAVLAGLLTPGPR